MNTGIANQSVMGARTHNPIRRKLTRISMLVCGTALLLVCAALLGYDLVMFRATMVSDLESIADSVGENSTEALTIDKPSSARQILRSLNTHAHIMSAVLYDKNGQLFAVYYRKDVQDFEPPLVGSDGHKFEANSLKLMRRITAGGELLGFVYLESDLKEVQERLRHYAAITALVLLVASLVALLISKRLHANISGSISHLANVANAVAAEKNYSIRASKAHDDELSSLIDDFNEMLNQIQHHDLALQEARNELGKRIEERTKELAESLALLNATLESSTDGIIAHQFGRGLLFHNSVYKEMWNMPDELLQHASLDLERVAWVANQTIEPQCFIDRHREIRSRAGHQDFVVMQLKDGRVIERYVNPQRVNGEPIGIVATFRDVTARKKAEQELENAHQQLLESSRQAGMAEVATGVLHNVGNVLNSVNVSANLLSENIARSRLRSLGKAVELIKQQQHRLGEFMSDDPKGRLLPDFLAQLSAHLFGEQQAAQKELDGLRKNIEHIKQIVSMQQSFAKVSGMRELVSLSDIVEDSLRLNASSLQRHDIRVVREFEELPPINTEKHKILQILVNLVRNAKYACNESGRTDKCVLIRIAAEAGRALISISDNGVGIASENLTRIFIHGFTTRKNGHGFGLHSGALTARELGGSLQAFSDGPGAGATFVLELPLEVAEEVTTPVALPKRLQATAS